MAENQDYKELLQVLNKHQVEYLIVGGYAVMKYSEPRYTKDLDVWVGKSAPNAKRMFDALGEFGAPLAQDGVTPETFTKDGVVYQIGLAPLRVDILTHIDGVEFGDAWRTRAASDFLGIPVNFISLTDLVKNKEAAGRTRDLEHLTLIRKKAPGKNDS